MFQHIPELLIILVIALIFFGPERLPEVASTVGRVMREVRQALDTAMNPEDHEVQDDFSNYYYESLARSGDDMEIHPDPLAAESEHAVPAAHAEEDAGMHDSAPGTSGQGGAKPVE